MVEDTDGLTLRMVGHRSMVHHVWWAILGMVTHRRLWSGIVALFKIAMVDHGQSMP